MADTTKIEWTDATWNPITGCSLASPGCTNCYAMGLAGTRLQHHPSRAGLTTMTKAGPVWNGQVRFNEEWLTQPLRWKRPRKVFVCAHGDLFHENVPDAWIDRVFSVMALAPQHTFQVLTKRASRMRGYLARSGVVGNEASCPGHVILAAMDRLSRTKWPDLRWPLPNVWMGVSVEDQKRADERIPDLLATPAAVRWISAEPLLGPVNLRFIPVDEQYSPDSDPHNDLNALTGVVSNLAVPYVEHRAKLDWVVVGGESGTNARPMHPAWARSLRDQCAAAGVPFLFKQWGAWGIAPEYAAQDGLQWTYLSHDGRQLGSGASREQGAFRMAKLGKTRAGRLLDGVEHNSYPEVR